jgi:prophage regulatory protein
MVAPLLNFLVHIMKRGDALLNPRERLLNPNEARKRDGMKILSPNDVVKITGLSRTTIWREEKRGKFPKRVQLSERRVGFMEAEILNWAKSRLHVDGSQHIQPSP